MKPAAAVVIIQGVAGTVLGVSRPHDPQDFGLPGGSVEPGESAEAAAIREVFEETGLVVRGLELLEQGSYHEREVHCFVAKSFTGELRRSEEGVVAWVTWEQLGRGTYGDYNRRIQQVLPELRTSDSR